MFAPTYLSEEDRKRLVEINSRLTGGVLFDAAGAPQGEERDRMLAERDEIMSRMKPIAECNFEELQSIRKELYEKYQKCAMIKSPQVRTISAFLRQVEFRISLLARQSATTEKTNAKADATRPNRIRSKQHSYSWTVKLEGRDRDDQ